MVAGTYLSPDYISFQEVPEFQPTNDSFSRENFKVVNLGGVAFVGDSVLEQQLHAHVHPAVNLNCMVDAMGEWVAVAEHIKSDASREYLVFSDPFGYAPVFYSYVSTRDLLVVSDSFWGVAAGLADFGVKPTLNVGHYLSVIAAEAPASEGPLGGQTMFHEIGILEVDQLLLVTSKGVSLEPRRRLGGAATIDEYEVALEHGLYQASQVISTTRRFPEVSKRITLSGGVDSRLCFGALTLAGEINNFQVDSKDPRQWPNKNTKTTIEKDIQLADSLRAQSDLEWYSPDKRTAVSLDFREVLAKHQSFRSNYSYSFRPSSLHSYVDLGLFTIRGGGGEILRSTAAGRAMTKLYSAQHSGAKLTDANTSRWLTEKYTTRAYIADALRPVLECHVQGLVHVAEDQLFEQHLNNLYFRGRNRAHFGHTRFDQTANDLCILPLSNAALLRASSLISFHDKAEGRIVKDLFAAMEPGLLGIPFENDQWSTILHGSMQSSSTAKDYDWSFTYDNRRTNSGGQRFKDAWKAGIRGEAHSFDPRGSGLNYILAGFNAIESYVGGDVARLLKEQHQIALEAVYAGYLPLYETVSKVASVIDGLFPHQSLARSINKTCVPRVQSGDYPFTVDLNPIGFSNDGWNNTQPVEHTASIELKNSSLVVDCHLKSGWTADLKYAFYIYRNGKRCKEYWYTDRNVACLAGPIEDGEYFAVSFVRRQKQKDVIFSEYTNKITVRNGQQENS